MNSTKLYEDNKEISKCNSNAEQKYSFKLTPKDLLDGIILSEILGEPKGKKGLVSYNVHKSTHSR